MCYTPDDLSERIMQKHLVKSLSLPYVDVDVALSNIRYVQVRNARMYRAEDAFAALDEHYRRRIAENTAQYGARGADIFRRRAAVCTERLERVRKYAENWRKEHE